jgi:cell division septal protein FtsQ
MARPDILNGARIREIRKRQKRIFYAKVYLGSFLLVALLVGLVFLSRNQKIQIEKVNIYGNSAITTEEIMQLVDSELTGKYLFVIPKHNIFLYPKSRIERSISRNFLRISDVEIKIDNLKEITITVVEREGKYLWCSPPTDEGGEKCYFADETGYMFDEAPYFSGNTYFKFTGGFAEAEEKLGQFILLKDEFLRLIKFYEGTSEAISPIKLTALEIGNNGDYKFSMEGTEGKIIFKKENDFEKILENLNSAVSGDPLKTDLAEKLKSLLYVDLRFDNKVYFKFQ